MVRTTVYLPEELKLELERMARRLGSSEADLIRAGVRLVVAGNDPAEPAFPLFESGQPELAERVDDELSGFGER